MKKPNRLSRQALHKQLVEMHEKQLRSLYTRLDGQFPIAIEQNGWIEPKNVQWWMQPYMWSYQDYGFTYSETYRRATRHPVDPLAVACIDKFATDVAMARLRGEHLASPPWPSLRFVPFDEISIWS